MQNLLEMSSVLRGLEELGLEITPDLLATNPPFDRLIEYCDHWHSEPSQGRFDHDALLGQPIHRFLLEYDQVPEWSRLWIQQQEQGPELLDLLDLAEKLDVIGLADTIGVVLKRSADRDPQAFCKTMQLDNDPTDL